MDTNGFAGQYTMPDAGVIAKTWRPDDKGGAEAVNAFLRYTDNRAAVAHLIADHALNDLRDKIGPLGTLAEKDVKRWRDAHQEAIKALDAHIPGFLDGVASATAADRTLVEAGRAHKAAIDAAQASAAAEAIATDKARADTLKGQNAADKDNTAGRLAERREADRAADAADREVTGRLVKDNRDAVAAQDAQGKADMKAGIATARGLS